MRRLAYRDTAVAIGNGRYLNVPIATGKLLTEAYLLPTDKVLLIGAAGGYTAAVLGAAGRVGRRGRKRSRSCRARARLRWPAMANVTLVEGPLEKGHAKGAPYDVLVVDGCVEQVPERWSSQVAPGGRVVAGHRRARRAPARDGPRDQGRVRAARLRRHRLRRAARVRRAARLCVLNEGGNLMRVSVLLAGVAMIGVVAGPAAADTLREALVKAYNTNPALAAARANVRATDENVPIAKSAGRPDVSVNGGYTENALNSSELAGVAGSPVAGATRSSTVPVFSGGRVRNSVKGAEIRVDAARDQLRGTESDLFVGTVGAYMDVIRDEAIVGLNQENVKVLEVNLQATRDRFQVGDLTRTDVAQSEARLALARSQLETAQARLISSQESYIRVGRHAAGRARGAARAAQPAGGARRGGRRRAEEQSQPARRAARGRRDAIRHQRRARGRLPTRVAASSAAITSIISARSAPGTGPKPGQTGSAGTVGLQFTVPLFQGGSPVGADPPGAGRRAPGAGDR